MTYPNGNFLVETGWLAEHLGDPELRVIDCRTSLAITDDGEVKFSSAQDEWMAGHIPGAVHVDIRTQLSDQQAEFPFMRPSADQFAAVMSGLGVSDDKRVILYDEFYNIWSARLWWLLRSFGFSNAAILNGGLTKWKLEDRALATGREMVEPANFSAQPDETIFVGQDRILDAIDDADTQIVDALPTDHYSGKSPFWVHRPGHIPTAENLAYSAVVDPESHAYLPPDDLARAIGELRDDRNGSAITYCHAGNAASSVAFALALMGHENVAIYDASLREWAADDSLPMELSPA